MQESRSLLMKFTILLITFTTLQVGSIEARKLTSTQVLSTPSQQVNHSYSPTQSTSSHKLEHLSISNNVKLLMVIIKNNLAFCKGSDNFAISREFN